MNHKEVVRQISELDGDDFSLLECAVGEPSRELEDGLTRVVSLHIGLEAEDLEDVSIAEQLETLLEQLRLDAGGRMSADSGTVSDVDSSVTTLEEDQRKSSEKVVPCGTRGEVSGDTELMSGETGGVEGTKGSLDRDLCETHFEVMDRAASGKGSTDCNVGKIHRVNRHIPWNRGGKIAVLEGVQFPPKKVDEKTVKLKETTTHPGVAQRKSKVPRAEVPQQAHCKGEGELKDLNKKTVRFAEAQPERASSSSPTEGGPFITHWGKGRWKRSGGSRDWSRNTHNSQSRQRYSTAATTWPRYSARSHPSDKYPPQSHRRTGRVQKGDSLGPQHGVNKSLTSQRERENSPGSQQRIDRSPAPTCKPSIPTVGSALQSTVLSTSSEKKLSYASVAGCVSGNKTKPAVAEKPSQQRTTSATAAAAVLQCDQAIAASFNYSEVVQFLWNGESKLESL